MENEIFEKAPVPKAFFTMALPVVFSMVISLVYNMVDTYFIARTGNTNLVAGVSLGAPIFSLMIALGDIFGLGGSSVISRLFGEKKDADGKRLSVFCFYGAILCGIVITALMLLFRHPILGLLGADTDTYTYASQYYTWLVLGAPFIIVALTPSNLLRTEGFAKASMIGTILGSVVNIILDPIFISVLGFGAAGAAIATVIGNICSDIFFVWFLLTRSKRLSVSPSGFYIHKAELLQIFAIGIPASITNLMQSLGIALTNRSLLPFGNDRVAAMGIVTILLSLAARPMIRIFMKDNTIVSLGVPMLRMQLLGMVFVAIVLVTTCTFQSAGMARNAFLLSISRQGVIFAIVLAIASHTIGYQGILLSQAISDLLTAVLAIALYRTSVAKELHT